MTIGSPRPVRVAARPSPCSLGIRLGPLTLIVVALALVIGEPAAWAEGCAPLDAPLVTYENEDTPFAVRIEQPESWSTRPQASGRALDFFEGESQAKSEYLFRFNAMGPVDTAAMTRGWQDVPDEVFEVELEDGGKLLIRHPSPFQTFTAMVPTPEGNGKAHMVSAGVVHAPRACNEAAVEALAKMVRGLRPSSP